MKNKIVMLAATKDVVHDSPGFAKKLLADADKIDGVGAHLELGGLCGAGCLYCSSNTGNFLRIHREEFANETERQLGELIAPVDFTTADGRAFKADPALTFSWPDAIQKLTAQIGRMGPAWGAGRMIVVSQLTDPFSPRWVADGVTEAALRLLFTRTKFKVRVLTKFATVAKSPFLPLLVEHRDRERGGLSTGTLDDEWAKRVEIGTSPPSARVRAVRALQDAGVPTYGMLCPVFPDALFATAPEMRVEALLDAIRPERCAHVFFEALNDRGTWQAVASGYPDGHAGRAWIERVWRDGHVEDWSAYAAALHRRVMAKARAGGWEARHLLYEDMILSPDHQAFAADGKYAALDGVLLQSPTTRNNFNAGVRSGEGWSRNVLIRDMQTTPDHGQAEGWKKARRHPACAIGAT